MALAEPIARLSLDRRVIFKEDSAITERLDVQYPALSAIESGASPEEIIEHVAGEAARMKPTLTEEAMHFGGPAVHVTMGDDYRIAVQHNGEEFFITPRWEDDKAECDLCRHWMMDIRRRAGGLGIR